MPYTPETAGSVSRGELITEIKRVTKLLNAAIKRAEAREVVIDKLTAAHLRVQILMRKLTG